jgi:hypothetical protein
MHINLLIKNTLCINKKALINEDQGGVLIKVSRLGTGSGL